MNPSNTVTLKGLKGEFTNSHRDTEFENVPKNYPSSLPSLVHTTSDSGNATTSDHSRSDSFELLKPPSLLDPLPADPVRLVRQRSDTIEGKPTHLAPIEKPLEHTSTPEIRKSKSLTKKLKQLSAHRSDNNSPAVIPTPSLERNQSDTSSIEKVPMLVRALSNASPMMMRSTSGPDIENNSVTTSTSSVLSTPYPTTIESLLEASSSTHTPTSIKHREVSKSLPLGILSPTQGHNKIVRTVAPSNNPPVLALVKPQTPITISEKRTVSTGEDSPSVYQHFSLPKSVVTSSANSSSHINSSNNTLLGGVKSVNSTPKTALHKSIQPQIHHHSSLLPNSSTLQSNDDSQSLHLVENFSEAVKVNDRLNENDRILRERLQEAKALNRKEDSSGATMFKFSLWGAGNQTNRANTTIDNSSTDSFIPPVFPLNTTTTPSMSNKNSNSSDNPEEGRSTGKFSHRIRGLKNTRDIDQQLLQSFSEDNTNSTSQLTAAMVGAISASISEKDLAKESGISVGHEVYHDPQSAHYMEESSREHADLSFLQERSNLDISMLGSSIHDTDGHSQHLETSYSDDDFVKEDVEVGHMIGSEQIQEIESSREELFEGIPLQELSFASDNTSLLSAHPGQLHPTVSTTVLRSTESNSIAGTTTGTVTTTSASRGMASALRSKVVGAKALHLNESPVANKVNHDRSLLEDVTPKVEVETSHTAVVNRSKSRSNSRVLRRLDFSSFTSEVSEEVETSYSSFVQKTKANTKGTGSKGSKTAPGEDIFASITHVDEDESSLEENDEEEGYASSSVVEEEEGIPHKSPFSRSHSFNLDDHTVAASSVHTMLSKSGPVTFNSQNKMSHYLEIPDDGSLSGTDSHQQKVRRATSSQVELQGIAYEESVKMVRSLTSRDQPRDRGHPQPQQPSQSTNTLTNHEPKKEDESKRRKTTGAINESKASLNISHPVETKEEGKPEVTPSLQPSKSSEKLSKYQKLKNFRQAKKKSASNNNTTSIVPPVNVSSTAPIPSTEHETITKRRTPSSGNDRELATTDREENNSSPMLSEVSNDDEEEMAREGITRITDEEALRHHTTNTIMTTSPPPANFSQPYHSSSHYPTGESISHSQSMVEIPLDAPLPSQVTTGRGGGGTVIKTETRSKSPVSFIKGEVIGEGTFGKVFKGMNETTGELLAIKQFFLSDGTQQEVDELQREINVMWELNHENIVRYRGTTKTEKYLYIILEYVTGGSIANMLTQFGAFSENLIRRFSFQILRGVEYLHEKGIIHRDIKGANILVTDTGIAKLADFGCSKRVAGLCTISLEASMYALKGSVPWMAPEVIKQSGYGRSSDIWSFGATVLEMATGKPPWSEYHDNLAALFHVATSTTPPTVPSHLTATCAEFITSCMMIEPDKRATAKALLRQSEFLKNEIIKYGIQNNPLTLSDDGSSRRNSQSNQGDNNSSQLANRGQATTGSRGNSSQPVSSQKRNSTSTTGNNNRIGQGVASTGNTRPKGTNRIGKKSDK